MAAFRRDQPKRIVRTINGGIQPSPEGAGIPRRHRMFVECERRLADHPLTQPAASGQPLGDGNGLEDLVATIASLFATERSLVRWVVLRGAFTELYVRVLDPGSAVTSPAALERAMGLTWAPAPENRLMLANPWRTSLPPAEHEAALGIAAAVLLRVEEYPRYSKLSVDEVLRLPQANMSYAVALDCLAWCATALLRLGIAQQIMRQVPEPDALDEPGWYPEPLFAKADRYWNGSDWTERCRTSDGRVVSIRL